MSDFLDGKNALIFSYGVTNAGKTFTIQGKNEKEKHNSHYSEHSMSCQVLSTVLYCTDLGTPKEPGILPRVLDATFHHIGGRQYEGMDLKPYLRNDAQYLDPDRVKQERSAKAAIFAPVKEVRTVTL